MKQLPIVARVPVFVLFSCRRVFIDFICVNDFSYRKIKVWLLQVHTLTDIVQFAARYSILGRTIYHIPLLCGCYAYAHSFFYFHHRFPRSVYALKCSLYWHAHMRDLQLHALNWTARTTGAIRVCHEGYRQRQVGEYADTWYKQI